MRTIEMLNSRRRTCTSTNSGGSSNSQSKTFKIPATCIKTFSGAVRRKSDLGALRRMFGGGVRGMVWKLGIDKSDGRREEPAKRERREESVSSPLARLPSFLYLKRAQNAKTNQRIQPE